MRSYEVRLSLLAVEDLIALHHWVMSGADRAIADPYIARVEARIGSLAQFPKRGTPCDDLVAGLRSLAFERRLVIAYKLEGAAVTVLRIISGARDLGQQF